MDDDGTAPCLLKRADSISSIDGQYLSVQFPYSVKIAQGLQSSNLLKNYEDLGMDIKDPRHGAK